MAATQQTAELPSSQLTHVAIGETKPPQSAQKQQTDSSNNNTTPHTHVEMQNAGDNVSGNIENFAGDGSSFTASLHKYRETLNNDFEVFEQNIDKAQPPGESIEDYDWDDLENNYQKEIARFVMTERDIMNQFDDRFKVCRNTRIWILLT